MFIDKNILYAIFKIENVFINIYFIGGVIKIKKYVSLFIFLLVLLIPIQVFAEYQQFVRRSDTFKVGQYGQFEQCVVINKDLSTKVISFNSWGNYAVKNNNGYSITMVSRKHEKKNNKLYIYLTVKGYDFNTKKYSSNYNFSFTISFEFSLEKILFISSLRTLRLCVTSIFRAKIAKTAKIILDLFLSKILWDLFLA